MLIKLDKKLKTDAQKIAKEMGLPFSTVITTYLKHFVKRKAILLSTTHTMTPYLEEVMRQGKIDYKAGKNISPVFKNAEDALEWLDK